MNAQRAIHGLVFLAFATLASARTARGPMLPPDLVNGAALIAAAAIANRLSRSNPRSALLTIPLWMLGWYRWTLIAAAGIAALLLVFRSRPEDPPLFGFKRTRSALQIVAGAFLAVTFLPALFAFVGVRSFSRTHASKGKRAGLLRQLEGTDPEARRAAISVLAELDYDDLVPVFIGLAGDRDDEIRRSAAGALRDRKSDITPAILQAIEKADSLAATDLWNVAAHHRSRRAIVPALAAMSDPRLEIRAAAAGALEAAIYPALAPVGPDVIEEELAPHHDTLLALVNDQSIEVRRTAVIALGLIEHAAAAAALIRVFTNEDENDDIRYEAAVALGRIGAEEAAGPLAAGLEREAFETAAAQALRQLGRGLDEVLARVNSTELDDWDEPMKLRAIEALGKLGDPAAAPALIAQAADPDARVRKSATGAIGHLLNNVLNAPLLAGNRLPDPITDDEGWERLKAVVLPTLAARLEDPDPLVRWTAIDAFTWPEGTVKRMLDDRDADVRDAAARALERLPAGQVS